MSETQVRSQEASSPVGQNFEELALKSSSTTDDLYELRAGRPVTTAARSSAICGGQ